MFIALTETWLNNNFHTAELGLCNYDIFRHDRSPITSFCNRGCGKLVAVCNDITSFPLLIPNNNVEQLFVRFTLNSLNFIICSLHTPPSLPIDLYVTYLNTFEFTIQQYPNHIIITCFHYKL